MAVKKATENTALYEETETMGGNTANNAAAPVSEANTEKDRKEDENVNRFEKEQIIKSKKYENYKDILNVVLGESRYTIDEVDKLIKEFFEKEVK